jgi:hypothetical protein
MPTSGKSNFGFEQLSGRSLVAYPPARTSPFNSYLSTCQRICDENTVIAFTRTRAKLSLVMSASGKRLGRRGVNAIFTPDGENRDARLVVGLSGIVVGIILWITVALDSGYPNLFGASEIGSYVSMVFASLGIVFVISGAGICQGYYALRPAHRNDSALDAEDPSSNHAVLSIRESSLQGYGELRAGILSSKNLRLGLITFIQSCVMLSLYSGLADEYHSNLSMRLWVSSVFPYGGLVLSWEAVLATAALLGFIVVQFLPGKALAE